MRILFIILLACSLNQNLRAQVESPRKQSPQKEIKEGQSSKREMQAGMLSAINELNTQIADLEKQITEARKNKEDEGTIKEMEDQVAMLKKQLKMMGGLNKTVSGISEKTFQQAGEEGKTIVPKKDIARISILPKKILSDAELLSFVKIVNIEVEKILPAEEKKEALAIYTETKVKYKLPAAVSSAASGCWMFGHWEKALFLIGRACTDDIPDPDNLNNYAAFLISTGGEQAALPILDYLNKKYPENSTILNNMGQAWFGLGDLDNAKKYFDATITLYPTHSQTNVTLSEIYRSQNDTPRAIAALRNSVSDTYDPDKESQLTQLGYTLDYDDLPDFDYPIDADNGDPMGFIAFFKTVPALPLNVDEVKSAQKKLNGFKVALRKKLEEAAALMLAENKKQKQLSEKMVSDGAVGKKILELLNSPPHKLAIAKALKSKVKKEAGQTPQKTEMLEPAEIFDRCAARYEVEVLTPRQQHLDAAMQKLEEIEKRYKPCAAAEANPCGNGWQVKMCAEANAVKNTFLKKDEELKKLGESIFTETFFKYKKELIEELKVKYYQEYNTALLQQQVSGGIHRRIIERKSSFYANYYSFLTRFNNYYNKIKIEFSKCETRFAPIYYTEEVDDQLVSLTDFKEPKCTFSKEIDNGVTKIKMICNELLKESDKIQEKQSNVSKGAGLSGSPGIQQGNNGPVAPGRGGPATHFQEINEPDWSRGPLKAEVKDLSQYSIEFDRWGNMTGLKFQLNKEGTGLADPDSKESGVDSRWSWNAAGSANKGFLNRLLIK